MKTKAERRLIKMKSINVILIAVLMLAIFASSFAIAKDLQEDSSEVELGSVDDVEAPLNESDTDSVVDELNKSITKFRSVGFTEATYGQGWIISGDSGFLVNAIWATHTVSKIETQDLKAIRDQYKGDPKAAKEALKNLSSQSLEKISLGRIIIGTGKDETPFRLNMTSSDNKSVSFDLLSPRKEGNEKLGTLSLTGVKYSNMVLWTGKLVITSGDKSGSYDISIATKTNIVKGLGKSLETRNDLGKGLENRGQERDRDNENKSGQGENQGKKKGFMQRLAFWKR